MGGTSGALQGFRLNPRWMPCVSSPPGLSSPGLNSSEDFSLPFDQVRGPPEAKGAGLTRVSQKYLLNFISGMRYVCRRSGAESL